MIAEKKIETAEGEKNGELLFDQGHLTTDLIPILTFQVRLVI